MTTSFFARGGGWVIAQFLIMLAVAILGVKYRGGEMRLGFIIAGACLFAMGGAVGVAGAVTLKSNLTPFPKPVSHAQLIQHGIYAHIRHPLYTSVLLAALGWAVAWQSWPALAATAVLVIFFYAKARREEGWLREAFPEYRAYERRVRRFLPGIF
jgi:protein-S-isoprenylcysteine O-methyltransferase Ste14